MLVRSHPGSLHGRTDLIAADHYQSNALLWTFIFHYKWPFLACVLPRLSFTGFIFAQPFLVERVLKFMTEPEHVNSTNYAHGLIAAYAIVYFGIAVGSKASSTRNSALAYCHISRSLMQFTNTRPYGSSPWSEAA